jgi:DNA polymerase-3 subunit gamma/tau
VAAPKPYVVLARKYRPKTFDELVGQPAVAQTLRNALGSGRIAHGYLFTGPRGVGKTTMARILAKALNCKKGPTPEPCSECTACQEIAASNCLDVMEIDAASHTGVDNVREVIIETVGLAPNRDRYKVFIIDETHMLSTPAFNALLKTIEEPPPHVVFILATTEAAKVPATIASRCQRFKFRPVSVEDLAAHLGRLAKEEKIKITKDALELLARAADGSLRDAVSLLDQCRSYSTEDITADLIREMFGLVPQDLLKQLAQALLDRDASALGSCLKTVYEEGVDPAQVLRDLRAGFEAKYIERVQAGQPAEQLAFLLRRVNETLADLRTGDSPRLTLELGLFSAIEAAADLRQWVERLEALERRLSSGGALPPAPAPRLAASQPAFKPVVAAAAAASAGTGWTGLLAAADADKPTLAALLRNAKFTAPNKITFKRSFDKDQAERQKAWIEAKLSTSVLLELGDVGGPTTADLSQDSVSEQPAPKGGWSDAAESPKSAPASSEGMKRAAKILGGTARVVKKKDA